MSSILSPVVVLLAIIVTGNHFLLDAAAGALLDLVALFVAWRAAAPQSAAAQP